MKFTVSRLALFVLPFLLVLTACKKEVVSDVLATHEKAYPNIQKKYVYQSLIRLANLKHDPDFEKLIKDVRKVIIYLPPAEDSTYQIKDLRTSMRSGGYEELVDVRIAEAQRISLWVKESTSTAHYLALVDSDKDDLILEIDGQLDLQYLASINMADKGSLMNLIQGGF